MKSSTVIACLLALFFTACGKPPVPPRPAVPQQPPQGDPPPRDPPPATPAAWAPRATPIEGDIVVAVIDTGVDATHPALKGKVLEGVSLAPVPGTTEDAIGHGTAVAGLVCADAEDDQFDGVCAKQPVKILPIKVTGDLGAEALPTAVGLAVTEAVKRGAHVVCIPMGGSFTTDALESGMALAKEKGVLVLAAAGIGTPATHDFYPAAHPWAISCTGEREARTETFAGREMQWYYRADYANWSGKTELMGPIFAKVLAPGDGYASLQGTSVACARAAGLAAKLIAANRSWSAQRVRDVLTLSGSPDYAGNAYAHCPARHVDAEILDDATKSPPKEKSDLAVLWIEPEPWPKPDQAFRARVEVRNVGAAPGAGSVTFRIASENVEVKVPISELLPGEGCTVRIPVPGLKQGKFLSEVEVFEDKAASLANNRLIAKLAVDPRDNAAGCGLVWLEGMRADSDELVLHGLASNPNDRALETAISVAVAEPDARLQLRLNPFESRWVRLPMVIGKPGGGKKGVAVVVKTVEEGESFGNVTVLLDVSRTTYSPQYADVWGLKEIIVDAPASISTARSTLPIMLFTPEIHTAQLPERFLYEDGDTGELYAGSGLWLSDVMIDLLSGPQAATHVPQPRFDPHVPTGRCLFRAHQELGSSVLSGPVTFWNRGRSARVENWCGTKVGRDQFLGWKRHDGWHAVIVVPREDVEYFAQQDYDRVRDEYFRVAVHYFSLAKHPSVTNSKRRGYDERTEEQDQELWQETVLRVTFNVDPPRLDDRGHYYDVHVHTAAEFSRDAVEPRLAFGGPPWMIARSAHAMGLIDDEDLLTVLLRVHPAGQAFAARWNLQLGEDVLITTDHNCFLSDTDEPTAAPWGGRFGGNEIGVLRESFGRCDNQELSMAKPFAATGAMHALVYGAEPMEGPWHGGRGMRGMLAAIRDTLEAVALTDRAMDYLGWHPKTKRLKPPTWVIAKLLHLLKYGAGVTEQQSAEVRDGLQECLKSVLDQHTRRDIDPSLIRRFCDMWGDTSQADLRALLDQIDAVLESAEHRPEKNPWDVVATEDRMARDDAAYVAAHPFLGTKSFRHADDVARSTSTGDREARGTPWIQEGLPLGPGDLAWLEGELKRAANLAGIHRNAARYPHRFPFRGVQLWNEPHFYATALDSPNDLTMLNIWRTGVLKPQPKWFDELGFGVHYYLKELVQPGLRWSFEPDLRREDGATRLLLRKLFHYAGSDAHGSFNFTTGVGASMLTEPRFEAIFALLGHGHGTETHTSHYGAARVYAEKESLDEVLAGRVVCTDGPVVWPELDTDVKFDSLALLWHDSWRAASQGINRDGEIGGGGDFDGARTALARRGCPDMVLRWRAAGDRGLRGPVRRIECYRVTASQDRVPRATRGMPLPFLEPAVTAPCAEHADTQFALLGSALGPGEPQALLVAGYTAEEDRALFDVEQRRCLANPIWVSTVKIGATAAPVVADGKAFIPPGALIATFRTDHSGADVGPGGAGKGAPPVVWARQLDVKGDSVLGRWRLKPVWRGDAVGYWDNEERQIGGKVLRVADCLMTAVNEEPIPLRPDWYPIEGVDTFAIMWEKPQDAFGNVLNAVADLLEVAVPAGTVTTGDPGSPGDPGVEPEPKPVESGRGPNGGPPDTATVQVRPGETVQLPKGGTCDGKRIPPGDWTVPDLPAAGVSLVVSAGGQTLTILLRETPSPSPAFLDQTTRGFYGAAPTPGQGPATVSLKNHTQKTLEAPVPVVVSGSTCVFSAPLAEPGACDVTVIQGGASKTTSIEAVAPRIAWDQPDAQPGETRVLRVTLEGAKSPGDWSLSGTVEIANGQVMSVADPARIALKGPVLTLDALPASVRDIAQVQAQQSGTMIATARLRVRRNAER
ncbi:MAG: S8 family serine peptidase [Planctomycetia bacterium]|nr:S8 family serine peptidase [Planctomycetia bacterium]